MTHDDRTPTMDELERRLADLPRTMPFPPTPGIAARIGDALPARRPAPFQRRTVWYALAAAALLILLTAALPGPRHAVADFLGLPGIRIELVPRSEKTGPPTSIGSTLLLGERSTLDAAQRTVPFPIRVHGTPDEVYLRNEGGVTAVSLLYRATPDLPQIGQTGVGMLLMEFRTTGDAPFLAKRAMGSGMLLVTTVNGRDAFWIENGELVVLPPDLTAPDTAPGYARPSGNVLIWSDGQTTYRMETTLDRQAAVAIAASLTAPEGNP